MHIAILNDTLPPEGVGDAAEAAWALGHGLIAAGHRVTFISSTRDRARVEQRGGITVHWLRSTYAARWMAWFGLFNPQIVVPLNLALHKLRPDVVHAHDIHQHLSYHSLVIARIAARAGTVFTSRDTHPFAYRPLQLPPESIDAADCDDHDYHLSPAHNFRQVGLRWNPARNLSIRHTMRYYTDVHLAPSREHQRALAANHLPRFEVLLEGVDPSRPNAAAVEALRQRLRLNGRRVILFPGEPVGADGEAPMLAALRRVRRQVPDVALLVLDREGTRAERLHRENPDLEAQIVVLAEPGESSPRAAACALADVLALPATAFVPFPRIVLHAMAAGAPPIVSCFGGAREAVQDGASGYVIHPYDVDALADRLLRLLQDAPLRRQMGERAQARVRKAYTLDRHVQAILAVYERALTRRKEPA